MKKIRKVGISKIIHNHIANNKKEYIIFTLIFIIGLFLGVMFINNCKTTQLDEIKQYFESFIEKLKATEKLDISKLLKNTLKENIILAISLWFFATTVIGLPIVFGIILYTGFCLGCTISTIILTLGVKKGILFIFSSIFLQNIIFIPSILALGVSRI